MKIFIDILRLIRYKNLLIIIITFFVFEVYILESYLNELSTNINFYLLLFITLLIASSGYVINDIFDVHIDRINRKSKVIIGERYSVKTAKRLYLLLITSSISASIILCSRIENMLSMSIFISCICILFIYSRSLKHKLFIGNITTSFLVSLSIINLIIFSTVEINENSKLVLYFYACFSFVITFVREIIKDIEDLKGDLEYKSKNIPIKLGIKNSKKICYILLSILFISISYATLENYKYSYLDIGTTYSISYYLIISSLIIYCAISIILANQRYDYSRVSLLIKQIILISILLIPIFKHI